MPGREQTKRFIADAVIDAPRDQVENALVIVDGSRRDTKAVAPHKGGAFASPRRAVA